MHDIFLPSYPSYSLPRRILPQELIDYIIDCLQTDVKSLKACALASRVFVDRCQLYIHHSIDLDCDRCPDIPPDSYSSPHVAAYVRDLHVALLPNPEDPDPPLPTNPDDDDPHQSQKRYPVSVWRLLSKLTSLECVTLMLFDSMHTRRTRHFFVPIFKNVKDLRFDNATFCHVFEFMEFLTLFPRLTQLDISLLRWNGPFDTSLLPPRVAPQEVPGLMLEELTFGWQGCERNVLDDLASHWLPLLPENNVSSIRFLWHPRNPPITLPPLLQALGKSLGSLEIPTSEFPEAMMGIGSFGIHYCTDVRSIVFADLGQWRVPVDDAEGWVLRFVSQITSENISELTFSWAHIAEGLEEFKYNDVDTVLADPQFRHLKTVVFEVPRAFFGRRSSLDHKIKKGFRRAFSRGILQVVYR